MSYRTLPAPHGLVAVVIEPGRHEGEKTRCRHHTVLALRVDTTRGEDDITVMPIVGEAIMSDDMALLPYADGAGWFTVSGALHHCRFLTIEEAMAAFDAYNRRFGRRRA